MKKQTPHLGNYVAYYRVSTARQGASGLGLEAQKTTVKNHLNGGDWKIVGEFTELESGKKSDRQRPELSKAIALAEKENATLVVAKLDRLTRNVSFLSKLLDNKVQVICCDVPQMGNPATTKYMLQILASTAEFEAEQISMRTKAALSAAKKRGVNLGAPDPKIGSPIGVQVRQKKADAYAAEVYKIILELQKFGCDTLQKICHGLEARGVQTPTGKSKWYPSSVKNLIGRIKNVR